MAGAGIYVGAKAKHDWKVRSVTFLAPGQIEGDGMSVEIGFGWILVEKPPRERPSAWPYYPFCSCCRHMRAHHGAVEHPNQIGRRAQAGKVLKENLKNTRLAQSGKALPDTVQCP